MNPVRICSLSQWGVRRILTKVPRFKNEQPSVRVVEGSGLCVCIRFSARETEILDSNATFVHKSLENRIEVDGDVGSLCYTSNADYLAARGPL